VRRCWVRVPAAEAERAAARMLELFPDGLVEEADGDHVVLSGYAERAPADWLESEPVAEGWADAWREYHRPVRVGRLWIGPPWFEAEELPVVIDPGHAFGTGAHGSTRAALELLQRLPPGPVLDLGCGSGVLSIAAARLGCGPLRAFDLDPLAVSAARENAARNGVHLEVALADVLADPLPEAPLWIANLQLDLLERLLVRRDLAPLVLASGLTDDQSLDALGVEVAGRAVVDGWAAELVSTGDRP
jgi:ribosomal protein L11 methyltransferase